MDRESASQDDADPPLQRRASAPVVPGRWLTGVAEQEARKLEEFAGDRDLLDRLMWRDYEGPEYERFAERLARYGYGVMRAWCATGLVFDKCTAKGWKLPRRRISQDAAEELALETVAVALVKFRETVLIPRVWDPAKGASLHTFFIGQCLLRFLNVYRRWINEAGDDPLEPVDQVDLAVSRNPEGRALQRSELGERLAPLGPVDRAIIVLKAEDRTNEEIAEICGITLAQVKSRYYRIQRAQKEKGDAA